jgi:hypothetical protein
MTDGMVPWLPHRGLSLEFTLRHRDPVHLRIIYMLDLIFEILKSSFNSLRLGVFQNYG